MSTTRYLLVISADRKVRIAKRPKIYADEIAIPVVLEFPDHWGHVLAEPINITVPDFSPEVRYEQDDD